MPIIERSEELFAAIQELDSRKTAEVIAQIHNSPNVSLLSYNRGNFLLYYPPFDKIRDHLLKRF
jgi:hypothetical protein